MHLTNEVILMTDYGYTETTTCFNKKIKQFDYCILKAFFKKNGQFKTLQGLPDVSSKWFCKYDILEI